MERFDFPIALEILHVEGENPVDATGQHRRDQARVMRGFPRDPIGGDEATPLVEYRKLG
jgi:hypothetical protein